MTRRITSRARTTTLDDFVVGFQASHARTDGRGLGIGENALKLTRSPSSHGTRHKIQRSKNISCGKRSRSVLDQDLDSSVEVVQISLPKSSKKSRPFQHSSIVPDWVPSNGLQSISQKFMEDEPWNIIPDSHPSSKSPVRKSILLPGHTKGSKPIVK